MAETRKMASVKVIDKISPIDGADRLEAATVGGWDVVVVKGKHTVGEKIVYCEIDSFIPTKTAPFLTKPGHTPKTYLEIPGERLRTVKLRGQISQGLIMSLAETGLSDSLEVGTDVSEVLGVVKYDPPMPTALHGIAAGNFPSFIRKTDQERIQNLSKDLEKWKTAGMEFEVSEKLDGSSCTMFLGEEKELRVCSRNLELKETEGNSFWAAGRKLGVEEKLRALGKNYALQGELVGPSIQSNTLCLPDVTYYVYDIFDIDTQQYLNSTERLQVLKDAGLPSVPILPSITFDASVSMESLIAMADGNSVFSTIGQNVILREGLVFKSKTTQDSFKAISNKWLLKNE